MLVRAPALVVALVAAALSFAAPSAFAQLPPRPPTDPATLDVGLHGGIGVRIGGSQSFQVEDRAGPVFGGSVWLSPSRYFGIGLEYNHTDLGRETSGDVGALGTVEITRALNAAWGGLRLGLFRNDIVQTWVGIGVGLVWQNEQASGLSIAGLGQPGQSFACSASDDASFGLRAGAGAAIALGSDLYLAPEVIVEGEPLSSATLGNCTAGPGSIGVFSARLGFFYRFDVSRHVR